MPTGSPRRQGSVKQPTKPLFFIYICSICFPSFPIQCRQPRAIARHLDVTWHHRGWRKPWPVQRSRASPYKGHAEDLEAQTGPADSPRLKPWPFPARFGEAPPGALELGASAMELWEARLSSPSAPSQPMASTARLQRR